MAHDLAVFTCARLGLIRVNDQVRWATIAFLGHKGPFQARRETRTATTTQAGLFHLIDDPVTTLFDDLGSSIPMAALLSACQCTVVHPVKVGKDPVLVLKHTPLASI
jgi:hypothetical protein